MKAEIFIGFDEREQDGYDVTHDSMLRYNPNLNIKMIQLQGCVATNLYTRPFRKLDGQLFDIISNAPQATEFALTRFLLPWLTEHSDTEWAIFMDCDMLVRCDLEKELFPLLDESKAIMCVKHWINHEEGSKMDGCKQTHYRCKNWSSVMAWNLNHPSIKRLRLLDVNNLSGLDLHKFNWLADEEIGALPKVFNHLVGVQNPNPDAKIVHYTLGIPSMKGYENCEHSEEWKEVLSTY